MSDRKEQILQAAVQIITEQGYGKLTMRALARASGLKLGALQYHYPTWNDLLQALAVYVIHTYTAGLDNSGDGEIDLPLSDLIAFLMRDDEGDFPLNSDRLWPQLWAMGHVEPQMQALLDEIYGRAHWLLTQRLEEAGSKDPHTEALVLLSLIEGGSFFLEQSRPWNKDREAFVNFVQTYIDTRYSDANTL